MSNLKVTSVRYFETRRGTGYQVKTNVDGIEIWNDGEGGPIFLEGSSRDLLPYKHLTEKDLHKLIDNFENDKTPLKKFRIFLEEELGGATSIIAHEKSEENLRSRLNGLPLMKVEEVTDE
jgi:hypothetical protein